MEMNKEIKDILKQLSLVKSEVGSKHLVSRLADLVEESDANVRCIIEDGECVDVLLRLWDLGILKTCSPHYAASLSLIMQRLVSCEHALPMPSTREQVWTRLTTQQRLKSVYSLVSSGNRTKISSGLLLLKSVATCGSRHVDKLLQVFDFSLRSLKTVSLPPKIPKTVADGDTILQMEEMWKSRDLSKRPTRAAFVEFLCAMLRNAQGESIAVLLQLRPLLGSLLHYISKDPKSVQKEIMQVIRENIFLVPAEEVSPVTKERLVTHVFLHQLIGIIVQAFEAEETALRSQARDLVLTALTDPQVGLACMGHDDTFSLSDAMMDGTLVHRTWKGDADANVGNRKKVLRLLFQLKPWECHEIVFIFKRVFLHDPFLASLFLLQLPFDLEPRLASNWLVYAGITVAALKVLSDYTYEFDSLKMGSTSKLTRNVMNSLKSILISIPRNSLSRGMQHCNKLIASSTFRITYWMLKLVISVVVALSHGASSPDKGFSINMIELNALKQQMKVIFPDIQLILSCLSRTGSGSPASKDVPSVQKHAILSVLEMTIQLFPEALVDNHIKIESFVPESLRLEHFHHQCQYLSLMMRQTEDVHRESEEGKITLDYRLSTSFLNVLGLYQATKSDRVKRMAHEWLLWQLLQTKLFVTCTWEAKVWLQALSNEYSPPVSEFLVDALKIVVKRPDTGYQYLMAPDNSLDSISPLFVLVWQRVCRVIRSKKKGPEEKLAVLRYLASALVITLLQIAEPHLVLRVVFKIFMEEQGALLYSQEKEAKRTWKDEELHKKPWAPFLDSEGLSLLGMIMELTSTVQVHRSKIKSRLKKQRKMRDTEQGREADNLASECYSQFHSELPKIVCFIKDVTYIENIEIFIDTMCTKTKSENRTNAIGMLLDTDLDTELSLGTIKHLLCNRPFSLDTTLVALFLDSISDQKADLIISCFMLKASAKMWQMVLQKYLFLAASSNCNNSDDDVSILPIIETLVSVVNRSDIHGCQSNAYPLVECCLERISALSTETPDIALLFRIGVMIEPIMSDDHRHRLIVSMLFFLYELDFSSDALRARSALSLLAASLHSYGSLTADRTLDLLRKVYTKVLGYLEDNNETMIWTEDACRLVVEIGISVPFQFPESAFDIAVAHCLRIRTISSLSVLSLLIRRMIGVAQTISYLKSEIIELAAQDSLYEKRIGLAKVMILTSYLLTTDSLFTSQDQEFLSVEILKSFLRLLVSKKEVSVFKCGDDDAIWTNMIAIAPELCSRMIRTQSQSLNLKKLMQTIENEIQDLSSIKQIEGPNIPIDTKISVLHSIVASLSNLRKEPEYTSKFETIWTEIVCTYAVLNMKLLLIAYRSNKLLNQEARSLHALDMVVGEELIAFSDMDRGSSPFLQLIYYLNRRWIPSVLTYRGRSASTWRTVRRFFAAIPPEESRSFCTPVEAGFKIYQSIVDSLIRLISHESVLDLLKDKYACPLPLEKEALHLEKPVDSTVVYVGTTLRDATVHALDMSLSNSCMMKADVCELLEILLDIEVFLRGEQMVNPSFHENSEMQISRRQLERAEEALLPYLMASYGASMSPTDLAVWSLARTLNKRCWKQQQDNLEMLPPIQENIVALMNGPLFTFRFSWGKAALKTSLSTPATEFRDFPLQVARCAATCANFPDWRTVALSDRVPDQSTSNENFPLEYMVPFSSSGYDPAFLLPACNCWLRNNLIGIQEMIRSMLLSLCFRALASPDIYMRSFAWECISLANSIAANETFEEKKQIMFLFAWIRNGMEVPFGRLNSAHALFLAELAVSMFHPTSTMFSVITRVLTRTSYLDEMTIPLVKQLIMNGSPLMEKSKATWLHRYLVGSLRAPNDVHLFVKDHIFEVCMHLAANQFQELEVSWLAMSLIHRASLIPRASRMLTDESGLLAWLAKYIVHETRLMKTASTRRKLRYHSELLQLAQHAWNNLIKWKGVLERGNMYERKERETELNLSKGSMQYFC